MFFCKYQKKKWKWKFLNIEDKIEIFNFIEFLIPYPLFGGQCISTQFWRKLLKLEGLFKKKKKKIICEN